MEISLCDGTINLTAVNKVSTSDVRAYVQRDLSPASSLFVCVCVCFCRDGAVVLFTSLLKANYFVHQDVKMQGYFSSSLSAAEHN